MEGSLVIRRHSHPVSLKIRDLIEQHARETWLAERYDHVFQICDELIKNALKSNYQFLMLWLATRQRLMEATPDLGIQEANEWLSEVFFCGENILIEKQLEKMPDPKQMQLTIRRLLDLENELTKFKDRAGPSAVTRRELREKFDPLFRIKRLSRQLKINVHFRIERTARQLVITVQNDAPILERDVNRIKYVRDKFKAYADRGAPQAFFIENLDTSGGGHGLGYALMDSILMDLKLSPEKCLFLVPADRTLVLLALPLDR